MGKINEVGAVKEQYATAGNLNTRISVHDKYSTNPLGFANWIISNYRISAGARVLELGCGNGSMWKGRDELISSCEKLVLSDFSEGMLEAATRTLSGYDQIEYRVIDIQDIPYEDDAFDVVIANMMLYHVPDLEKGISEVQRILKKDGIFYCATYGENGIMPYIGSLLEPQNIHIENKLNTNFTLQNGEARLKKFFDRVQTFYYEDSLAVTDIDDMVKYIYSLTSMAALRDIPQEKVRGILKANMENGVLNIPKEYGMFAAGF